jgi:hypothetical protein
MQPNRSDGASRLDVEKTESENRIFVQLFPLAWACPCLSPGGYGRCDNSGRIQIASASGAAH